MKKRLQKLSGFTLIELLTVIAIIGILAGILIPTVGSVKNKANIAAGKAQLSSYVSAIEMFKSEYKYYPDFGQGRGTSEESFEVSLSNSADSQAFIVGLSGRQPDLDALGSTEEDYGNRRRISFYSFSQTEFLDGDPVESDYQLTDRFGNKNIFIVMDKNGNGQVEPTGPLDSDTTQVRVSVTAYVEEDTDTLSDTFGAPSYHLWD